MAESYTFADAEAWANTTPAYDDEFTPMPAGGYICKIVKADFDKSKAGNDMLILFVDIAEGDFAGCFAATAKRFQPKAGWPNHAIVRRNVLDADGKPSRFFKGLLNVIAESNNGLQLSAGGTIHASQLVGKMCGFVFGDEEYPKQDGSIGVRAAVRSAKTLDDIREGNFKIPPLKKLDADKSPTHQRTNQYSKPPESPDPPSPAGEVVDLEDPPF